MKKLSLIVVALFFILHSCSVDKNYYKVYLEELTAQIDQNKLNLFKNGVITDNDSTINLLYSEVRNSINRLPLSDSVSIFLDSLFSKEELKTTFVVLSLHNFCNNRSIETNTILTNYKALARLRQSKEAAIFSSHLNQIVFQNDSLFQEGDTLSAIFISDTTFGGKHLAYNNMVSDSVYLRFDPMYEVLAELESKSYAHRANGRIDSTDLVFKCRILKMSDSGGFHRDRILEVGSDIQISVRSYGRLFGDSKKYLDWRK